MIAGPAKSGRSTVLMNFAQSFLAQGTRLVVAAPRQSPLRQLEGTEGVLKVFTGDDIDEDEFEELIDEASLEEPIAVLIDDGEILEDCDAESQLKKVVSRGAERGLALVIAGDEEDVCSGFSGWQVDAKKARRGILLSPQESSSGDLIGVRLSRGWSAGRSPRARGCCTSGTASCGRSSSRAESDAPSRGRVALADRRPGYSVFESRAFGRPESLLSDS